jgi:ATP-dependent DNA helicase RecG
MGNVSFGLNQQKTLHLQTADGVYTNLGFLLSDQSVHTIKLAVFEGIEKEVFKDRREFSGSLLKQLEDVYAFLDMNNHNHGEVKGLYREDRRDYQEEALREALLNALVHRDYAFSSSTLISVFEDRIEFVSVGGLLKGISLDDIMLGLSAPRNINLANVFYRLRLIEAYGTGIQRIFRSYAQRAKMPELRASGNAFKITLPNRNTANYYTHINSPSLTVNEEKVIYLFDNQKEIVRKDVETALDVSQAMAVRILRSLTDKQTIRPVGGGKKTRYVKADSSTSPRLSQS